MSILNVKNIKKSYGKEEVLKDISFEIEKPKIIALVGPNGSGKSTLLNILTNLLQPDQGNVSIFGIPNTNPDIFRETSYMQDNTVLYDYLTGYDHLQFIADIQSLTKDRIMEVARLIGIDTYINKKTGEYSLGMKQHLLLTMAMLNNPKLLILDEPLNGLDPSSAIKVRNILLDLVDRRTTILLSSHNLGEIDRITTEIFFLNQGMLLKEDLSKFEEIVYTITVDQTEKAKELLLKLDPMVFVEMNKLIISTKLNSLQDILHELHTNSILVIDIEKRIHGSEERYRQIFSDKEKEDETYSV